MARADDSTQGAASPAAEGDYKATLFLPETALPMKAGLAEAEPRHLAHWEAMGLYRRLRARSSGKTPFILHDGPPYANGEIHIGTALNKILKDIIVRSQQMMGKDANYIPGWDCHGLPIEWKVEERYRAKGQSKDEVPVVEFRAECRAFATHWLSVQREQFKRLGGVGDWDDPYTTMAFHAEATIAKEFMKFLMNGLLYRGSKPVMWSVVEKTALAEAEIEYQEHVSNTIFVKFPVRKGSSSVSGASVVIWTTTPWTIPGNRAIAFSTDIAYGVYEVKALVEGAASKIGDKLILSDALAETVKNAGKIETLERLGDVDPNGLVCAHPLHAAGYAFDVPVLAGDFVTEETGTGFVHIAPGHGQDDYALGMKNNIEVPMTVDEDGSYFAHVPLFAGKKVLTAEGKDGDANGAVMRELALAGALLAKGKLRHQYPHSWRSKAPVIFRNTPQWFIAMDRPCTDLGDKTLREIALAEIDRVEFTPAQGRNRIRSMVENRPDWVVSRQRAWGVPLTLFVRKSDGELLRDRDVNARIVEAFEQEGADAWYTSPPERFLGAGYRTEDFDQVFDILDVWFDSGSTHAFVLEDRLKLTHPASLYLEGSDQHRGWFQSSLLESCGTRGRAPYDGVLTHGFVLDEKGEEKMSKSKGNTLSPQDVTSRNGADILRLWVAASDYSNDIRFGPGIVQSSVDVYRKLRNTLRFTLANLSKFRESERVPQAEMPELDRYILHRLAELDALVRDGYERFDFSRAFHAMVNFCNGDLSAFYYDIRKDTLYCDAPDAMRRRAVRTVLDEIFGRLTRWLAPVLCFTMEEVWQTRFPDTDDSVHLHEFLPTPQGWRDEALAERWGRIRALRRVVTGALEIERRDKRIGASLEAAPVLYLENADDVALMAGIDLAEIAITSAARIANGTAPSDAFRLEDVAGAAVVVGRAQGAKCARCWMILPDVGTHAHAPGVCGRCADAVATLAREDA